MNKIGNNFLILDYKVDVVELLDTEAQECRFFFFESPWEQHLCQHLLVSNDLSQQESSIKRNPYFTGNSIFPEAMISHALYRLRH